MAEKLSFGKIRKLAKALSNTIESQNNEEVVSYFADNCEIELPGIKLTGRDDLRKAVVWIHQHYKEITLIPIIIMIGGNIFFEEFIFRAEIKDSKEIQMKQTSVIIYNDDYKVKSLRLYFDRLELADAYNSDPAEKIMLSQLSEASSQGLL